MNIINLTGSDSYSYLTHAFPTFRVPELDFAPYLFFHPCYLKHKPHECDFQSVVLGQMPIYLVTRESVGRKFDVPLLGRTDSFVVPYDRRKDPLYGVDLGKLAETFSGMSGDTGHYSPSADMDGCECEDEGPREAGRPYEGDNFDESIIDMLGVYECDHPSKGRFPISQVRPRIFIWVDKISDFAGGCYSKNMAIFMQVMLSSLSLAAMDPAILAGVQRRRYAGPDAKAMETLRTLKESSLSMMLSLKLFRQIVDEEYYGACVDEGMFSYIHDLYLGGRIQDNLGVMYYDAMGGDRRDCFESIRYWMETFFHAINPAMASLWLEYVNTHDILEKEQLLLLDRGIVSSGRIYLNSQDGMYYDSHDIGVKVIMDYAGANPGITRSQMHAAFPDSINDDFEAIIDYPETTHFTDKTDLPHTRSVHKSNIFEVSDGKMAVCDYWHYDSMPDLIATAAGLGITITEIGG